MSFPDVAVVLDGEGLENWRARKESYLHQVHVEVFAQAHRHVGVRPQLLHMSVTIKLDISLISLDSPHSIPLCIQQVPICGQTQILVAPKHCNRARAHHGKGRRVALCQLGRLLDCTPYVRV